MLVFGIVTDYRKGFARVNLLDLGTVTDFLPILVRHSLNDKESSPVEINEHVVCLMDEQLLTGVILGAVPSSEDLPDPGEKPGVFRKLFKDGSLIEFDRGTGNLKADIRGNIEAKAGQNATIEAAGDITATAGANLALKAVKIDLTGIVSITGPVTVSGALAAAGITATGGTSISAPGSKISASEIDVQSLQIAGKDYALHVHGGVMNGGGITGPAQ